MRYLRAFGRFWADFILGDDPRVAAWVVGILALGALAVATGTIGTWTAPVLAALLFLGFSVLVLRHD